MSQELSTQRKLPMPTLDDPWGLGGQRIRELVQALDKLEKAGTAIAQPLNPAGAYGTVSVVFAQPFPVGSIVIATAVCLTSVRAATVGNVTRTGFDINVRQITGSNVTTPTDCMWRATLATQ